MLAINLAWELGENSKDRAYHMAKGKVSDTCGVSPVYSTRDKLLTDNDTFSLSQD